MRLLFRCYSGHADITINSVHTTISTCPNNGTATIYAHSTSDTAVFLYNTVAGPVIYPLQNDSTFSSLYPGNYTAWVHDVNSFDSTEVTFTITGTYQNLILTPISYTPLCAGQNDGSIIGNLTPGTGVGPYTWQIISPYVGAPQASDTFNNLSPDTFLVKVTDACGEARTQTAIVNPGGTGLTSLGLGFVRLGCDTYELGWVISLNKADAQYPLTLQTQTSFGTVIKKVWPQVLDTLLNPAEYTISDTIYGVAPGTYMHFCLIDTCGTSICFSGNAPQFTFNIQFVNTAGGCLSGYSAYLSPGGINTLGLPLYYPATVIVTSQVTGDTVDSYILTDTCHTCPVIPPLTGGQAYNITIRDTCGDTFLINTVWPSPPPANLGIAPGVQACRDSTGSAYIGYLGFGAVVGLQILSGPPISQSTKPGYTYRDSIIYPINYLNIAYQDYGNFSIGNMPPGQYVFRSVR